MHDKEKIAAGILESFSLSSTPESEPADKAKLFYPKNLYVLLRPAGPVALYTQQWRALNLVWALAHKCNCEGKALRQKTVVVVGAGAAGLTAAVSAALAGAKVHLLEKAGTPMNLQLGCEHRFLHPRFHEWPRKRSQSAAAQLPLLSWSVGTAGEVSNSIIDEFHWINDRLMKELGGGFHKVKTVYHVRDIVCREQRGSPNRCLVGYNVENMTTGAVQPENGIKCDVLILAVGFGVERTVNGVAPRSYWRTDPLTQPSIGLSGKKLRVLVAGDGDGGAIDVLRAALKQFDHGPFIDRIIEMTVANAPLCKGVKAANVVVQEALQKQEEKLREEYSERHDGVRTEAATIYNESYELLQGIEGAPMKELSKYLEGMARSDVEVTWIGKLPFASSLETYTLNRLLAWLVCKLPHVRYLPNRSLRRVEPVPIGGNGVGAWLGYSAWLQGCKLADGRYQDEDRWETEIWDEIIVRYGGIRPLEGEFGEWGRRLHKRWNDSARRETAQKLGEPGSGVTTFFAEALDRVPNPRPQMSLKASFLGEVGQARKVDEEVWPLFLFKLSIDPPAPSPPVEREASADCFPRADDWVEYHLHPYRNGIRRRANRGPEGDFSLLIFTRDDYWLDASFKGRRLEGGWLSQLVKNGDPCSPAELTACAQKLTACAQKLWTKGFPAPELPKLILDDTSFDTEFERKLTRAPDDQSPEPE